MHGEGVLALFFGSLLALNVQRVLVVAKLPKEMQSTGKESQPLLWTPLSPFVQCLSGVYAVPCLLTSVWPCVPTDMEGNLQVVA